MTDKDKIKFAIRYLKQGLKSKRTPPLYEELMNELGFVSEKELGKVEGKLADLTSEYYALENFKNNEIAELKKEQFTLRNERDTFLAQNEQYEKDLIGFNENFTEAKEIIKKFSEFANLEVEYDPEHPQEHTDIWNELCKKAEQFLKECE